jgi:hypothetical protein
MKVSQKTKPEPDASMFYRFVAAGDLGTDPSVLWAVDLLRCRLREKSISLSHAEDGTANGSAATTISISGPTGTQIQTACTNHGVAIPGSPESFAIFRDVVPGNSAVRICAADVRGLVYALTELADRVQFSSNVSSVFDLAEPILGTPTAKVRSTSRSFQSVVEDLAWFHDRDGWREYFAHLVTHRFNRFSLTMGMQYNYPYGNEFITDVYLHFAYPFLVAVPGYDVEAVGLTDEERTKNLETLKFIAREARRHGLEFNLALWTQYYDFDDCPNVNYPIAGITRDNHATYCRDALGEILSLVPDITGLTLRVHVESGIPEGEYDFWRTLLEAVSSCGRRISIDLHAKGIDDELISIALATGFPVCISPKYTSEHMGLPYHQASIRALERRSNEDSGKKSSAIESNLDSLYSGPDRHKHVAKWKFSEGSRKFMRYSFGDLLREDRPYDIVFRIWPGTHRVLLWGDPAIAGGYGRSSLLCGALGVELCEPLSFKGRMGTGIAGNREGYLDEKLVSRHDWQKFSYTYRVWGRSLYEPKADPDAWRRYLVAAFGAAADHCQVAIGGASRILPLIVLAHTPTASNNSYWPEMYENMSIIHEAPHLPYGYELTKPARFGTVGSCDPQLFMSPYEFARTLLSGQGIRKYSPLTWANWLHQLATTTLVEINRAQRLIDTQSPEFRRFSVDVSIHAAIGKFFAEKVRSAVLWELYLICGELLAAREAIRRYCLARDAWVIAADACKDVYVPDISYGPHSWLRGRWDDRLPAIDRDISDMERLVGNAESGSCTDSALNKSLVGQILGWSTSQRFTCWHTPPRGFVPGTDLKLSCALLGESRRNVQLHFRHVNQSEDWCCMEMTWKDEICVGHIPGSYTDSPYAIQYYFELCEQTYSSFYPGLMDDLSNQPYVVVSRNDQPSDNH